MARTVLAPIVSTRAGIAVPYTAANVDGHSIVNPGEGMMIHVKNGGASPINVTIKTAMKVDGRLVPDLVVAVPNASDRLIGPFQKEVYNQTGGTVNVDFSAITSVTVAAIQLGAA